MENKNDYVVLLHGIGRDPRVMRRLEQYLQTKGFNVYNDHYQSTSFSIDRLAEHVYRRIRRYCPDRSRKLHFVGHSMGGLITRLIINRYKPSSLGRVVMIAPPNKGSEVADFLQRFKLFKKVYGPAGQQLGTNENSIIHRLGPVDYELGVISGNRTVDPWFSWLVLPHANDGKVTIESTKIKGMQDHIILPASHKFIPKKKQTMEQVLCFLQHGKFKR